MSKITRQVTTKTLTLGTPETIQLPRNYALRSLVLRLSGTVDVTAVTVALTQLRQGAACILSNIRVRRDGKDTIQAIDGKALWELNRIMYGKTPVTGLVAVTTATGSTSSVTLTLPFENVMGVKPFDTLLKGPGLSSLDLLIDTQAAQNLFYTPATSGTVSVRTSFTLEVDTVEEDTDKNFVFGDIRVYLAQKVSVTGASNSFQIKPLPVGNYYKGILMLFEDTGVPTDSLVTNIKLKSGTEVFVDRPYQALQDELGQKQNIGTISTGVIYIDLMPDGSLNQALDLTPASGRETCEMELVTAAPSGTAYVYVYILEYVPPVVVAKK